MLNFCIQVIFFVALHNGEVTTCSTYIANVDIAIGSLGMRLLLYVV